MKKKIFEIWRHPYGQIILGVTYFCEPNMVDIGIAIHEVLCHEVDVEERGFQKNEEELANEFFKCFKESPHKAVSILRKYHASRSAKFVIDHENGIEWDAIELKDDDIQTKREIKDGSHRFLAAIYLGHKFIDVKD